MSLTTVDSEVRMACMEVWGGSEAVNAAVTLSGLDAWIYSRPYGENAEAGGDVYYVSACATGRIDAYLDVTEPEPLPVEHLLHRLPNVLLTPHIAGCQGSEVRRLGAYAVDEVERWAGGHALRGAVHAADLPRIA